MKSTFPIVGRNQAMKLMLRLAQQDQIKDMKRLMKRTAGTKKVGGQMNRSLHHFLTINYYKLLIGIGQFCVFVNRKLQDVGALCALRVTKGHWITKLELEAELELEDELAARRRERERATKPD